MKFFTKKFRGQTCAHTSGPGLGGGKPMSANATYFRFGIIVGAPLSHFFWDELSHFSKSPSKIGLKFIFGMAEINGGLFFFAIASAGRSSFSRWCSLILARIRAKTPGKSEGGDIDFAVFLFRPVQAFRASMRSLGEKPTRQNRVASFVFPVVAQAAKTPPARLRCAGDAYSN